MTESIKSFATIEEMFQYIRGQNTYAEFMQMDWQRALKPGDHVIRFFETFGCKLTCYWEILAPDADERLDPSMILVRGFSEACPEGEMGVEYRAGASLPCSREAFEEARKLNWPSLW
jgi:hypothetical protein